MESFFFWAGIISYKNGTNLRSIFASNEKSYIEERAI